MGLKKPGPSLSMSDPYSLARSLGFHDGAINKINWYDDGGPSDNPDDALRINDLFNDVVYDFGYADMTSLYVGTKGFYAGAIHQYRKFNTWQRLVDYHTIGGPDDGFVCEFDE